MKNVYLKPAIEAIELECSLELLDTKTLQGGGDDSGTGVADAKQRNDFSSFEYGNLWSDMKD
jgi:hypothetical protein